MCDTSDFVRLKLESHAPGLDRHRVQEEKEMSKKYESLARDIVANVGGKENVSNVYHCMTRLRFTLASNAKANKEALESLDGVTKVIINAGVYQVVIGPHVAEVFEEVTKLVDIEAKSDQTPTENKGVFNTIFDFISGTFQPVIPALSGAGMVKAVLAILVVLKVITTDSQTYYLLNMFADGVFYFLPLILAFTAAQKLKANPILAVSVGAMMLHPNWFNLVAAGEPVSFFGVIPFTLARYSSSVIPIILVVLVQSHVEKFLRKYVPKAVELVIVPLMTFLVMGTLAFSILGPIGTILGGYLATFFTFLSVNAAWAPAVLIGVFCPLMVMIGLHNAVAPLGVVQMSNLGFDSIWGPGNICSNMAQAAAATVVAFRTKNSQTRQIATSASVTAFMGITEPALYGVNLPKKYPLVASMIGGGLGGLYAGLTHTHRFATGSGGLPAVALYIGDDTMKFFYNIIIAMVISIVVSATLTFILSLKYEKSEDHESDQLTNGTASEGVFTIEAPLKGQVLPLDQCADEAFASGMIGQGVVIIPEQGRVIAPFDGTVATLFPTKHAIGLISTDGMELLIHIGIDTVNLGGKHFEALVKQGDQVKAGQPLVEFDIEGIEKAGYSTQTMILVTNHGNYSNIKAADRKRIDYSESLLGVEG